MEDAPFNPSEGYFVKGIMKPKVQTILSYLEKVAKEVILENLYRAQEGVSGIRFVS